MILCWTLTVTHCHSQALTLILFWLWLYTLQWRVNSGDLGPQQSVGNSLSTCTCAVLSLVVVGRVGRITQSARQSGLHKYRSGPTAPSLLVCPSGLFPGITTELVMLLSPQSALTWMMRLGKNRFFQRLFFYFLRFFWEKHK